MSQVVHAETVKAARRELRRRALMELRRRDVLAWEDEICNQILASMTRKQRLVYDRIEAGKRFISLSCGRRAGKTTFIAKLIVMKLVRARHKQAVYYVAESLQVGKDIIWLDIDRELKRYFLDELWKVVENECRVTTTTGGLFRILGLNKEKQGNMTRGTKPILFAIDECQNYGHLLKPTLTSVGPGLTDHKGVFIAAGTGSFSEDDPWTAISERGEGGFECFNWTILDNEHFPQDPEETLREEMERNGYTEEHPDYIREWMGRRSVDLTKFALEYLTGRNSCDELPPEFGDHWRKVIGMDFGHDDAITWNVVAANPFGPERIVLWAEAISGLDELPKEVGLLDLAAERTRSLSIRFGTKYVSYDPAGGGKLFFEGFFNRKYGKAMGLNTKAANKLGKVESFAVMNNDLRTGRLKLYRPDSDTLVLAKELRRCMWKDKAKAEIYTNRSLGITDDNVDGLRMAYVEIGPWGAKEEPPEAPPPTPIEQAIQEAQAAWSKQVRLDPNARLREERNREAKVNPKGLLRRR